LIIILFILYSPTPKTQEEEGEEGGKEFGGEGN